MGYRTGLLREGGLVLPRHTFYVDNIFVYQSLPYVEDMYYLNIVLYKSREVTRCLLSCYDVTEIHNRMLHSYMIRYIEIMTAISSILAINSDNEEKIRKK